MSEIIELRNVDKLLEEANSISDPLVPPVVTEAVPGMPKSILKFKSISICEVFGYQIAEAIGVRVPQMQSFWTRKALRSRRYCADSGRVGILVSYHEDWKRLGRNKAVDLDVVQTARALALCVFDRHEWGEFGLSGGKVYFVDLERLLPAIQPEDLLAVSTIERMEKLDSLADQYSNGAFGAIGQFLKKLSGLKSSAE